MRHMTAPRIDALIFDFDGLILDTETPEYEAWREVYTEHGCELPLALWVDSIGRGHEQIKFDPYKYLSECTGKIVDNEAVRARRRLLFHERVDRMPPRPGVVDYLTEATARGLKLAVASSSDRDWVEGHLRRLDLLDYFALTRCSDDVARTKPAPDVYLAALEGLGVAAENAVAFEDSPNGTRAAHRAEIYTVAVPNALTARLEFLEADRRIESMAEMPLGQVLEMASMRCIS